MQEKKKQYILDNLLRIILAMFVLTVLFAFSCLLLSHGAHGIWLAVLALFVLLGVLGGVFLRRCLRIIQKNEQVMQLYAAGYTIADICHMECYFSKGTEMALKKAVALLDTSKLLSVSKRQAQYLALQNQINPHFLYNTLEGIRSEAVAGGLNVVADMTEYLAKFFRYTISKVENLVSVTEELENIETYFAIQQFRFGAGDPELSDPKADDAAACGECNYSWTGTKDRDRCSLGSADTDGKTADRTDLRQRSRDGAGNTAPASGRAVPNSL